MIPAPFRTLRALRALNVAAVGLALAAITSAVLGGMLGDGGGIAELAVGASTWLIGTLWAALLRSQKRVTRRAIRIGWVLSPPLAALNAALASGALFGSGPPSHLTGSYGAGALLGATVGAIIWLPALLGTLVCFGLPIAKAQRLAEKGLAGEERGEWLVGLASAVMSLAGLALTWAGAHRAETGQLVTGWLGVAGLVTGGGAAILATARARRRRKFVSEAEAGKVPGYRIDTTDEGKVLVRIVTQGQGYRVADFEEDVFDLDDRGEATRPRSLEVRDDGAASGPKPRPPAEASDDGAASGLEPQPAAEATPAGNLAQPPAPR